MEHMAAVVKRFIIIKMEQNMYYLDMKNDELHGEHKHARSYCIQTTSFAFLFRFLSFFIRTIWSHFSHSICCK